MLYESVAWICSRLVLASRSLERQLHRRADAESRSQERRDDVGRRRHDRVDGHDALDEGRLRRSRRLQDEPPLRPKLSLRVRPKKSTCISIKLFNQYSEYKSEFYSL